MNASETIKAELARVRGDLRDAARDARGTAGDAKATMVTRVERARRTRDTLRAQLHHDLCDRLQSLENEKSQLQTSLRGETAPARAKTEARIQELEKKIVASRDEFVAHADLTGAEFDDEIAALEASAQAISADARPTMEQQLNELKARRNTLREKTLALRNAAGDRLKKASAEFDEVMAELTEKRNQGMVGVN